MRHAWVLAVALVALPGVLDGQPAEGVLHVTVMLPDATQAPTPVARHLLLVSDNPATIEPRRVRTAADGTVTLKLRPGSYTVESDSPVAFLGQGYQWTQMVTVAAGRDVTLALTAANAEVVPITAVPTAGVGSATAAGAAPVSDTTVLRGRWEGSIVSVWTPTAPATGFLVDARGLVATDGVAVAGAAEVEVQMSRDVKVRGRVLASDPARGVALAWVNPAVFAGRPPLPLACPPAPAGALDMRQEIATLSAAIRTGLDLVSGEVTGHRPRAIDTDLRLGFGGTGGPVFDASGAVVGLTSSLADADATRRRGDAAVVRLSTLCEAMSKVVPTLAAGTPPSSGRLPVEPRPAAEVATRAAPAAPAATPGRPAPPAPPAAPGTGAATPVAVASADFDVAFVTAATLRRAREREGRTGGPPTRAQDVEARLGPLTDFGAWAEYFDDLPPVLIVRVTPKMVEGFWKRLGREALRTQGAVLPPLKDFKGSFVRLRASCGGEEITPIHPFVLEHALPGKDRDVIREGLYVFAPGDMVGCAELTLSLFAEKAPDKADILAVAPAVIQRLRQELAREP